MTYLKREDACVSNFDQGGLSPRPNPAYIITNLVTDTSVRSTTGNFIRTRTQGILKPPLGKRECKTATE